MAHFRDVILEDLGTLEGIQASLESGATEHIVLSDMEVLIRFHLKYVAQVLEGKC